MAFALSAKPKTKQGIQKKISLKDFFSSKKRKGIAIGGALAVALIGAYFIFFVGAAPNNCSAVEGGGICDVNQGSSPDGADSVVSLGDEVQVLHGRDGWTDWGVAFRAPNFPQNGARPLVRFFNASITAHFIVLEGSDEYNRIAADPGNGREGIVGYGWPDGSQPGTVPIYRVVRKPLWFMTLYVDNQNALNYFVNQTDGSYTDGGVNFYAYPGSYFPPVPVSAAIPAKDTDCANQNLKVGDVGACVQQHKGVLNKFVSVTGGTNLLDANNNTFDNTTSDYTKVFVVSLQQKGVNVQTFSGIVTKEIWDALAAGYPAALPPNRPAPGATTPAPQAPQTPAPTDPAKTNTTPPKKEEKSQGPGQKVVTPVVEPTAGSKGGGGGGSPVVVEAPKTPSCNKATVLGDIKSVEDYTNNIANALNKFFVITVKRPDTSGGQSLIEQSQSIKVQYTILRAQIQASKNAVVSDQCESARSAILQAHKVSTNLADKSNTFLKQLIASSILPAGDPIVVINRLVPGLNYKQIQFKLQ